MRELPLALEIGGACRDGFGLGLPFYPTWPPQLIVNRESNTGQVEVRRISAE
jgi:hypothetical protein